MNSVSLKTSAEEASNKAAGEAYFQHISSTKADVQTRAAFQSLALRIATPGAHILDFGSGPGIDARFYAERGYDVSAFDVDSRMCEFFKRHCATEIAARRVRLLECDYRQFLALNAVANTPVSLVTSNFAPLNLVPDLKTLFATLSGLCGHQGRILASVLNPYFLPEFRYRWRLSNQWRLWRRGHFSLRQLPGTVIRRHPDNFAEEANPHFVLERVFKGAPSEEIDAYVPNEEVARFGFMDWPPLANSVFLFLLFRKRS